MVRSGEASGQLNSILSDLAGEVEKSAGIRRKVKGAMMYPIFIVTVLLGVIVGMMMFVVPKISEAFEGAGAKLPALTQALIDTSRWMNANFVWVFAGLFAVILSIVFGKRTYS